MTNDSCAASFARRNGELVLEVLRAYPQIYHACHVKHARARTDPACISARESWILGHLDLQRPTAPAPLARHLGLRPSTLSEALKRLAKLGYLERRASREDRRRIEIYLTARGAEALAGANVLDASRVAALLQRLPERERARAVRGLERLATAARALQAEEPKPPRLHLGAER